jgi:acetyltransferase-like isoleucine patch superfamily enzyme
MAASRTEEAHYVMQQLDEQDFVRGRLFDSQKSTWRRYALLTVGEESLFKLLRFELVTMLFGYVPGALGLLLRKWFFPGLFKHCGRGVTFGRSLTLRNLQNVSLGEGVVIDDYAVIDGRGAADGGVTIGAHTILGRGCVVHSKVGPIDIGSDCNIGSNSAIVSFGGIEIAREVQIAGGCMVSGGRFRLERDGAGKVGLSRHTIGPVRIGEACFIGAHAAVMDGVTVGRYCVLGTGAVLTADLPENSVYMARIGMVLGKSLPDEQQEMEEDEE